MTLPALKQYGERLTGALCAIAILAGCAQHAGAPSPSPKPANPLLSTIVSATTLPTVERAVAHSDLTAADKSAFTAMVSQHRGKPAALNGKTVGEMINEERAYVMAVRMTAAARAADAKHRREMDALIMLSATPGQSDEGTLALNLNARNKSAKAIRSIDVGIEVHDAAGKRLGLAEFVLHRTMQPHAAIAFGYRLPYQKFGGDGRDVRAMRGKQLTIPLDVKSITYADGSTAGEGD
ncbi:MAG TPA: hypothetical protein VFO29_04625 [Candidatus Rubrimentiphilum sp.]|nr:hypothetical protein [Candidatus Rubrimentiphilum sp.]